MLVLHADQDGGILGELLQIALFRGQLFHHNHPLYGCHVGKGVQSTHQALINQRKNHCRFQNFVGKTRRLPVDDGIIISEKTARSMEHQRLFGAILQQLENLHQGGNYKENGVLGVPTRQQQVFLI